MTIERVDHSRFGKETGSQTLTPGHVENLAVRKIRNYAAGFKGVRMEVLSPDRIKISRFSVRDNVRRTSDVCELEKEDINLANLRGSCGRTFRWKP